MFAITRGTENERALLKNSGETALGILHTVLGIMSQKGYYRTEKCVKPTKAVKGLEHLFYKKDLLHLRLFQQEER